MLVLFVCWFSYKQFYSFTLLWLRHCNRKGACVCVCVCVCVCARDSERGGGGAHSLLCCGCCCCCCCCCCFMLWPLADTRDTRAHTSVTGLISTHPQTKS